MPRGPLPRMQQPSAGSAAEGHRGQGERPAVGFTRNLVHQPDLSSLARPTRTRVNARTSKGGRPSRLEAPTPRRRETLRRAASLRVLAEPVLPLSREQRLRTESAGQPLDQVEMLFAYGKAGRTTFQQLQRLGA
jgi:hypothetical protein